MLGCPHCNFGVLISSQSKPVYLLLIVQPCCTGLERIGCSSLSRSHASHYTGHLLSASQLPHPHLGAATEGSVVVLRLGSGGVLHSRWAAQVLSGLAGSEQQAASHEPDDEGDDDEPHDEHEDQGAVGLSLLVPLTDGVSRCQLLAACSAARAARFSFC